MKGLVLATRATSQIHEAPFAAGLLLAIVCTVAATSRLSAQGFRPSTAKEEGNDNALFLVEDSMRAAVAAASVVGMGNPPGAVGVLYAGRSTSTWDGLASRPPANGSRASATPGIDPHLLAGVEDRAPVRSLQENADEVRAYVYLLVRTREFSPEAFAASARRDLTYAHVFEEPGKYRGQVVQIEGRLRRLRRFDAPTFAAQQGVPVVYEAWVFDELSSRHPYCLVSTDLPTDLPLGERLDYPVSFAGYFFKRYRYQAGDGWRDAPLLIGRSLILQRRPAAVEADGWMADALVPGFLGLLLGSAMLAIGLGWWYRRSDRQIHVRLAQARPVDVLELRADQEPAPAEPAPGQNHTTV